jgi:hypothetical protein
MTMASPQARQDYSAGDDKLTVNLRLLKAHELTNSYVFNRLDRNINVLHEASGQCNLTEILQVAASFGMGIANMKEMSYRTVLASRSQPGRPDPESQRLEQQLGEYERLITSIEVEALAQATQVLSASCGQRYRGR